MVSNTSRLEFTGLSSKRHARNHTAMTNQSIRSLRSQANTDIFRRSSQSKTREQKMDTFKYNMENNAKTFQNKIDNILKRSVKKERYAENFMRNDRFVKKDKKQKRDVRRHNAIDVVK